MVTQAISDRRYRRRGANPVTERTSSFITGWPWRRRTDIPGKAVTDDTALSLTAFYRGIMVISTTIASLPIHIFRDEEYSETDDAGVVHQRTRHVPAGTPATRYLTHRPNVEMRRRAAVARLTADIVRGNGFMYIDKDQDDQPIGWWHLSRHRVKVGRNDNGLKVYEVDGYMPMIDYRQGGEIVHIPNWGDALVGYDPVNLAAQALSLGLSAQEYAVRTFAQGQIPPGIISVDAVLSRQQSNRIAREWERIHAGLRNQQRIAVMGHGAKFLQTSQDLDKMQMETLRRFQVEEVGRLIGVPLHLLMEMTKSTSWGSGLEEQNRGLWFFTLMNYVGLLEEAWTDDLLVNELTDRYAKINPAAILRGSTLQRYQAYRLANWMTANEKRGFEDLEPVAGGDVILEQTNQAPIEKFEDMDLSKPAAAGVAE